MILSGKAPRGEEPLVSVCVCTYKRSDMLERLLESLAKQIHEDFDIEVVVVDNDREGSARRCVETATRRHPSLRLRYSIEPCQGISFARNRSVAMACGEFLAFIDDDETAAPGWLAQHLRVLRQTGADAVFGPVLPVYVEGTPEWIVRGGFFERPRFASGTPIRYGDARCCNGMVRACWFNRPGGAVFDVGLAHSGGEDTALFLDLEERGARYVWCDEGCVSESVPLARQTVHWILERRLRSSTIYWRLRYQRCNGLARLARSLEGLSFFLPFCLVGLALRVSGPLHSTLLLSRACKGLGRVLALSSIRLTGYRAR
jgi:glycosyltransferase involved in cell wall biosynthesis